MAECLKLISGQLSVREGEGGRLEARTALLAWRYFLRPETLAYWLQRNLSRGGVEVGGVY